MEIIISSIIVEVIHSIWRNLFNNCVIIIPITLINNLLQFLPKKLMVIATSSHAPNFFLVLSTCLTGLRTRLEVGCLD